MLFINYGAGKTCRQHPALIEKTGFSWLRTAGMTGRQAGFKDRL